VRSETWSDYRHIIIIFRRASSTKHNLILEITTQQPKKLSINDLTSAFCICVWVGVCVWGQYIYIYLSEFWLYNQKFSYVCKCNFNEKERETGWMLIMNDYDLKSEWKMAVMLMWCDVTAMFIWSEKERRCICVSVKTWMCNNAIL